MQPGSVWICVAEEKRNQWTIPEDRLICEPLADSPRHSFPRLGPKETDILRDVFDTPLLLRRVCNVVFRAS